MLAVPLFQLFLEMEAATATYFSLVTVLVGALINWFFQRNEVDYGMGSLIALFSIPGSFLFTQVKANLSDLSISILFLLLVSFSLFQLWKTPKASPRKKKNTSRSQGVLFFAKGTLSGIALGGLSTLTGLGGGVVLVPWLSGPMKLPVQRALATSLYTVALGAIGSVYAQTKQMEGDFEVIGIAVLSIGCLLSGILVRAIVRRFPPHQVNLVRRAALSAIILFTIFGTIFSLLT